MPRTERVDVANEIYHIINRANARVQIFDTDDDYKQFESILEEAKENIMDTRYGLNDLLGIRVSDFTWKNDPSKSVSTGFIAQELYKIYPEAVSKPVDEKKMMH